MEYKQHAFVSGDVRKDLMKKFEADRLAEQGKR